MNLGPTNRATLLLERQPWGHIGVMIETGDEDFIAGAKITANRTRHGVGQRGHVGAEDDFVGAAIKKIGHGGARFIQHGVCVAAGGVGAAGVGVVMAQIVGDGVDYAARDLGSAGAIEEDGRMSVHGLGESGKLGANVLDVEGSTRGCFNDVHGSIYFYHGMLRGAWLP